MLYLKRVMILLRYYLNITFWKNCLTPRKHRLPGIFLSACYRCCYLFRPHQAFYERLASMRVRACARARAKFEAFAHRNAPKPCFQGFGGLLLAAWGGVISRQVMRAHRIPLKKTAGVAGKRARGGNPDPSEKKFRKIFCKNWKVGIFLSLHL